METRKGTAAEAKAIFGQMLGEPVKDLPQGAGGHVRPLLDPPETWPPGQRINIGCGPWYAEDWVNLDVVKDPTYGIVPDIVMDRFDELPFDDRSVTAVYMGHVLEHVRWDDRLQPYLAEVRRVLTPGGRVCVVGPDVRKGVKQWKRGDMPWDMLVDALFENEAGSPGMGMWEGHRHQWNCSEGRVIFALEAAGFMNVHGVALGSRELDFWPIVSRVDWQCAVIAQEP
jgi:SAM-dependent methyltransferase